MWENIKISLMDKNFRFKAIAILVVAFVIISFVLWFSFSVDAVSVSGVHYKVRFQDGYGGVYYPSSVSAGLDCLTGNYYYLYHFSVQTDSGQTVSLTTPSRYCTFSFDFSELNLSYDYDITIFASSSQRVSFDGFLTTAYSFSSSDPVVTVDRIVYNNLIFKESSIYVPSPTSSSYSYSYHSFSLNSLIVNNTLSVSLVGSTYNTTYSNIVFGFMISLSGTDFQQLLYRSGVTSTSEDYYQLIDDTRSALADGSITPDQAEIILDNATDTQSRAEVNRIVEAQSSLSNIVQQFINSSSSLSGSDLASSFENYSDRLYSIVQSYMGVISSPEEGIALSDVYQIVVRQLEQAYESLLTASYYNSLGFVNQSFDSYKQNESFLIDNVKSINLSNVIQITSWVDTLDEEEIFTFKTLLDSFVSNFSWSIFVQVPLYFTVIIALLGTSRSKEE